MKKYMYPEININIFDVESIVALSGDAQTYEDWTNEKKASSGTLDFATGIEVQVDMGA